MRVSGFDPVPIRGPRPLPLLGPFANVLRFFSDPVGKMLSLHREYGELATVSDRSPALVLAFGPTLNREVIGNPERFLHGSEIPVPAPEGSALSRFNTVLPFLNGEAHRRRRRLMMPAFAKSAIDAHADDIVAVTDAVLRRWPTGSVVDASALLRELTAAIALRCLFGLDALGGSEELGHVEAELLEALSSPLAIALPLRIPGTPFARAVAGAEKVEARLRAVIAERRRRAPNETERDVLSILLRARDEDGQSLGDAELIGESNGLFVAGYDTSAQTLSWTLLLLAQHPDVLAQVVDEVDAVLGGEPPTVGRLAELRHVDHVLKESMRLLPAAPMLFIRVCAKDATLGGVRLPEGASVVLSPLVTHRDPAVFSDPARFVPSRWESLAPGPYAYLPFGVGARMCLGAGFANLLLRVVLPMIVQRFRFAFADGARVDRSVRGIALAPKRGLPLTFAPQDGARGRRAALRGDLVELFEP